MGSAGRSGEIPDRCPKGEAFTPVNDTQLGF